MSFADIVTGGGAGSSAHSRDELEWQTLATNSKRTSPKHLKTLSTESIEEEEEEEDNTQMNMNGMSA